MKISNRDRLSSFPDALLLEILSRLPITTAITTSVLSHRWRPLWPQVTAFRFPIGAFRNPAKYNFFNIVDHIITRQLVSPIIHTFHLHIPYPPRGFFSRSHIFDDHWKKCSYYLNVWVTLISGRGVREIKVSSGLNPFVQPPACLFDCPSLLVLDLSSGFRFSLPFNEGVRDSISRRCNLVKLHLHLSLFDGDCESMEMLFKSCTLLEDLSLYCDSKCEVDRPFRLNIYGPKLKRLSLLLGYISSLLPEGLWVSIDAPNLEYFRVKDRNELGYYTFVKPPSVLMEADISLVHNSPSHGYAYQAASKLSPVISNVRKLTLRYNYLGVRPTTEFSARWNDLMRLLKCAPNLKVLELQQCFGPVIVLSNVGSCLSSKIKKVKLFGVDGTKDVKLIDYLLRYARGLEMLDISMYKSRNKEEQLRKEVNFCWDLSRLSGHPPNCKVRFIFGSKEVDEPTQHVVMQWKMSLVFPSQESKLAALEHLRRRNWGQTVTELEGLTIS